jgi:hypothetical protein
VPVLEAMALREVVTNLPMRDAVQDAAAGARRRTLGARSGLEDVSR